MVYPKMYILKKLFGSGTLNYTYARKLAKFIHENPDHYIKHKKLYNIFKLYEKRLFCLTHCFSELFDRDVLQYIAVRAYWSNLQDENFVSKLLVHLYFLDTNLKCIFLPQREWLTFHPSSNYGSTEKNVEKERICFTAFFLNLACKSRLVIDFKRITELHLHHHAFYMHPCEVAVRTRFPELLHLLLRYGALLGCDKKSIRGITQTRIATAATFFISINTIKIILDISQRKGWRIEALSKDVEYSKLVECGKLMMRVCPQFKKHAAAIEFRSLRRFRVRKQDLVWVIQNAIPEMKNLIFLPMTLKHACRLKLRHVLHNNWELPHGIKKLQIPNTLQRYLDLYCD